MRTTLTVQDVDLSLGYRLRPEPLNAGMKRYLSRCFRVLANLEPLGAPPNLAFKDALLRARRPRATGITSRNRRGLLRPGRLSPWQRRGRDALRDSHPCTPHLDQHGAEPRRLKSVAVALAIAVSMAGFSTPVGATSVEEYSARWINHDFIVELNDMPLTYTCHDLWNKFRDTLRAIGARPTDIVPYHCAQTSASWERSPRVEMTFQLPVRLQKQQVRWADFRMTEHSVEIAPGAPPSISAQDCQLIQRVNSELIQPLGINVLKSRFNCAGRRPTFDLLLTADTVAPGKTVAAR